MGGTDFLELLGTGTSLVVGTVSADGEPRATRAWAAEVHDGGARVRFVMSADDEAAVANLAGGRVAVTGADVRTLRSVQVKGRVVKVEPATAVDLAHATTHTDVFFQAVHETDGTAVPLLRRLVPQRVVAFELAVEESFDQSPGPDAGAAVRAAR